MRAPTARRPERPGRRRRRLAASDRRTSTNGESADTPLRPGPAIVAVVAGEGLAAGVRDFGVDQIVDGGQTANPSTGELLRVARLARAREVLLLPNNPNVRLAAEQAAKVCEDKRLVVVPTRNAAEGIAALLALDPTLDAAANAGPMTEASRAIQSVQVTEAVRDATIGGKKVKQGQTIALDPDDGLVAVDGDRDKAVLKAVAAFTAGLRADHALLRRRRDPGRGRGDRPEDRRRRRRAPRSRSSTAASRTTAT